MMKDGYLEIKQINDIKAILNKSNGEIKNCPCTNCDKLRKEPDFATFECEDCGYKGPPFLFECECYDDHCGGLGAQSNGADCLHGYTFCPVCEDGNVDFSEMIKEIRNVLT
jgi:hypothetical protein